MYPWSLGCEAACFTIRQLPFARARPFAGNRGQGALSSSVSASAEQHPGPCLQLSQPSSFPVARRQILTTKKTAAPNTISHAIIFPVICLPPTLTPFFHEITGLMLSPQKAGLSDIRRQREYIQEPSGTPLKKGPTSRISSPCI